MALKLHLAGRWLTVVPTVINFLLGTVFLIGGRSNTPIYIDVWAAKIFPYWLWVGGPSVVIGILLIAVTLPYIHKYEEIWH